jgi:hypothetical protein
VVAAAPPVKRGDRFVHATFLDPKWKPGEGKKYADAPHAECVVTRVAQGIAWYRYADGTGVGWKRPVSTFDDIVRERL